MMRSPTGRGPLSAAEIGWDRRARNRFAFARSYRSGLDWLSLRSRHGAGDVGRKLVYGAVVDLYPTLATFAEGSAGSAPPSGVVAGMQPARDVAIAAIAADVRNWQPIYRPRAEQTAANFAPDCVNMMFPDLLMNNRRTRASLRATPRQFFADQAIGGR
jgi:hypothetical protein